MRVDRQHRPQRLERSQHASGVDELIGTAQRRIGEPAVAPAATRPSPLERVTCHVEIVAEAPDVGTDGGSVVEHAFGGHRIADDRGSTGPQDAGFFKADAFPIRTEEFHVIQVDAGDDCAVGIDDIDRIQSTA